MSHDNIQGQLDMRQFHGVFFDETAENIAAFEEGLLRLDLENPDAEQLNSIFRAAHSIKGSSGTFGFQEMAQVTHELESLLDLARKEEVRLTTNDVDHLLRAGDTLRLQLAFFRGEGAADAYDTGSMCRELADLVAQAKRKDSAPAEAVPVSAEALVDDDDGAFGFYAPEPEVDVVAQAAPAAPTEPAGDGGFGWFDDPLPAAHVAKPDTAPVAKPDEAEKAKPQAARQRDKADASSLRVSVDKVDQLINLVGELVITQAMLEQSSAALDPAILETLKAGLTQLSRNTRDLQEAVLSVRMMPISQVFNRFPRMVRDISATLEKQVTLKLLGEATELDKILVEKLSDPLTHLVRNSIDHGIELPAERLAAGKPAAGTVTLAAYHQGGSIVIQVSDDGRGLSRDRILAKARERGLPADEAMSDGQVWRLIFEPGFSTAENVTALSGRGVGMDVVKRNIESLGGKVELSSSAGGGTVTTIRLPLTLAILDGISVAVSGQTFILPMANLVESLLPTDEQIKTVAGSARVIQVRDKYLPVIGLDAVFNMPARDDWTHQILVVIEGDGRQMALRVDALIGQHQVVIKSLEANYKRINGVSGATIMGDGSVALILDVPALIRVAGQ